MLHLLMLAGCWAGFYFLLISQTNHSRRLFKKEPENVLALRLAGFLLLFSALGLSCLSKDYGFYIVAWFGHLSLSATYWVWWLQRKI